MKANGYNTGDYVVGWFDNIVRLEKPITLSTGDDGFETDFVTGGFKQNISEESIKRRATNNEILKYKEKYDEK